jgi:ABC-2 type transport system ATP-binding protein
MRQRLGIAMALLGDPTLLVLDEPLNGLDADGMRIMREVFLDIVKDGTRSIVVSSHLLGELQKVATHYGIIRHGKMIAEMTAAELDANCRTYVALQSGEMNRTKMLLGCKYARVEEDEAGYMRVYDLTTPEEIVGYLYENGICVTEVGIDKIGLEEYYIDLMNGGKK